MRGILLVCLAPWVLAACAARTAVETEAPPGYVADAASRAARIDWAQAEPVTVRMDEYGYAPAELTFRTGRPYRLRIENAGAKAHTFTSEGFFRAIAAGSLTTPQGRIENPFVKQLELGAGQTAELQFVGVRAGDYPLVCDEPLHGILGMTGTIRLR